MNAAADGVVKFILGLEFTEIDGSKSAMKKLLRVAKSRITKIGLLAAIAAATLALSPVLTEAPLGVGQAFAHPGNGNGNGGNGNGNGHAPGGAGGGDGDGGASGIGPSNHGVVNSSLGALNAAHASKTALSHANPRSRVGKIAAYDRAVDTHKSTAAQLAAAQAAANKTVTKAVISALNGLLGDK